MDLPQTSKPTHQAEAKPLMEPKQIPPTGQKPNSLSRHLSDTWTKELVMCAVGASAVLVIFGILIAYNDLPLDSWKVSIQISTVIAVLSQIAQSSLLFTLSSCMGQLKWLWFKKESHPIADIEVFDSASRGPDGSFKLIWALPRL